MGCEPRKRRARGFENGCQFLDNGRFDASDIGDNGLIGEITVFRDDLAYPAHRSNRHRQNREISAFRSLLKLAKKLTFGESTLAQRIQCSLGVAPKRAIRRQAFARESQARLNHRGVRGRR